MNLQKELCFAVHFPLGLDLSHVSNREHIQTEIVRPETIGNTKTITHKTYQMRQFRTTAEVDEHEPAPIGHHAAAPSRTLVAKS